MCITSLGAVVCGMKSSFAPGTLKGEGNLGVTEIGVALGFLGFFIKVVFSNLAKRDLEIKHHPFLDESKHLHT